MCTVCGCSEMVTADGKVMSHEEAHRLGLDHHHAPAFRPESAPLPFPHVHAGGHDHHHYGTGAAGVSVPGMTQDRLIEVETSILAKNDAIAASNRRVLGALGVLALNLVSSPGAGKTTLLCRTIEALGDTPLAVIEGDQQTSADADRIRATGARALQINTGKGCHLDAQMVGHAIDDLRPRPGSCLFIENVGNLVCPAGFDLGEDAKVAILSVTEGEDKPRKYPPLFHSADVALITKIDLAVAVEFDRAAALASVQTVAPHATIIETSARTGQGLDAWIDYLAQRRAEL